MNRTSFIYVSLTILLITACTLFVRHDYEVVEGKGIFNKRTGEVYTKDYYGRWKN